VGSPYYALYDSKRSEIYDLMDNYNVITKSDLAEVLSDGTNKYSVNSAEVGTLWGILSTYLESVVGSVDGTVQAAFDDMKVVPFLQVLSFDDMYLGKEKAIYELLESKYPPPLSSVWHVGSYEVTAGNIANVLGVDAEHPAVVMLRYYLVSEGYIYPETAGKLQGYVTGKFAQLEKAKDINVDLLEKVENFDGTSSYSREELAAKQALLDQGLDKFSIFGKISKEDLLALTDEYGNSINLSLEEVNVLWEILGVLDYIDTENGGARLILTALSQLRETGGHRALATLCVGGGQGAALYLERP